MKRIYLILGLVVTLGCSIITTVEAEATNTQQFIIDETVVVATRYPELLSETPVSASLIKAGEIKEATADNLADLLGEVAGINLYNDYGEVGMKQINIRGSSSKDVLVLIDGQPINNPISGSIDLGQLSIDQIKQIEVLRGPASAIYGANATAGVVKITTKSGTPEPETKVETEFASFGRRNYNLTFRGSKDRLSYNLGLTKKESAGYREQSSLDQEIVFTKFDYQLSNQSRLSLSLHYNNSNQETPGDTYDEDSYLWASGPGKQEDTYKRANLTWHRKTAKRDTKASLDYYQHRLIDHLKQDANHREEKLGFDFSQTSYLKNQTLTYGLEVRQDKNDSKNHPSKWSPEEKWGKSRLSYGFFFQDDWQVNNSWKLNLGGRYDYHEEFGAEFSPRLGSIYNLNQNLSLYASVGKSYRAPNFMELYWPGSGNPDLKPELTIAYETGIKYLGQSSRFEFSLFKREIDEKIATNDDFKLKNIDSVAIKGGEIILTRYLTDNLSADFNYTYTDVRNQKTDQRLDRRPYHRANLGINYSKAGFSTGLKARYVGSRKEIGTSSDPTNPFAEKLPSHFVVDTRCSYQLPQETEIKLEVNNLFNKDYQVIDGYPKQGRNYSFKLSKTF